MGKQWYSRFNDPYRRPGKILVKKIFKDHPYTYIGRILIKLSSKERRRKLENNFFTKKFKPTFFEKILIKEIERQYYLLNESERKKLNREKFWGSSAGKKWHDLEKESFEQSIKESRYLLINQLSDFLSKNPKYKTICEIGTGNGMLLDHLSKKFKKVKNFMGIDINKAQIDENKRKYKNTNLKFIHSEITDLFNKKNLKNTLFISWGTLEFFTEKEIMELLKLIKKETTNSAIAIGEPTNIDLKKQKTSKPRGKAAYSHNYPFLLNKEGYKIIKQEIKPINPEAYLYNQIVLTAITN